MTLDFSDKSSLGYRRYREMLAVGKKMAARLDKQGRSAFEFWLWAAEETGMPEFRNCEQALFRAFCPNGEGNGVTNSCGPGQTAKSFPAGSQNLRDAVDSVAPAPEKVWDRSKGLAETPAPKEMDDIASEQTSYSGAALTPEAEASYGSLVDEIGRQYEALTAAGLKARAWRGDGEPYGDPPGSTKPNSDHMRKEIAKTGEYSFYMTDKGFGTGDATPNHPMLRETKYKTADGEPMIANDLFRVVHDMVAHVRGGYSFSTNGEYNGMLTHASTLPEAAWPALFAETFGQNAVYEKTKNYAPQNAYASKVGPEIIRSELKKRNKSSRAAKDDGDEPLGYQHIKSRPALLKSLVERRAFCATGDGNGIDNSCGAKTMSAPDKDGGGGSSGGKPLPSYANDIEHSMPKSKGFDDPKNSLAWLNPSGTFFPVSGDHGWYAERHGVDGGGDTLLDAGWLRVVGHSGSTMYVGNPSGFTPRGRQLSALKDFAISTDRIKRIIFDNGKSRSGAVLWQSDESRSADCGRDNDGRFSSGNKCGGSVDMPKEDPRGRMRYDNGVQTDAARKLYQMGTSESKLRTLVEAMGGDPKTTRADINPPSVNVSVMDASGQKLFHVDVENGRARLYPTKDLSPAESKKIREAASEAFGGKEDDVAIKVYRKASDIKKWDRENAAKLKKWEDKYAFSTMLPPHQRPKKWERSIDARHASLIAFAQSRGFCPNGEGNGVTNDCSSKDGGGGTPSYGTIKSDAAGRMREGEKPSEILDSLGFTNIRLEGEFDKAVAEPSGILHMIPAVRRSTASSVIAAMESAANRVPEMRDAKIAVRKREDHVADYVSRGMSREAEAVSQATATCNMQTGEISVYFDVDQSLFSKKLNHAIGLLSTPDPSHVIVHEYAHSVHAEGMRQFIANSILEETPNPQSDLDHHHVQIARNILSGKELNKDQLFNYEWKQSIVLDTLRDAIESSEELRDAVGSVSVYATSHPFEAIAEYWTAVTLGYKKNDKLLDSLCELGHCPVPKQRKSKT
jgi:hypothetical protein